MSRTEFPNDVVETRTYDDLNQLKVLEYSRLGTVFSKFDYTLDAAGNRRVVTELNGRKVEYEYDDLYRVTKETITDPVAGNRTVSYTYDSVGNRLSRNDSVGGVTTYVYDGNDRLKTEELKQNNVVVRSYEYGYDDNGNTKTRTEKNAAGNAVGTVTYSWDKENRLIGVQASDGNSVSYAYDVDGVRVSQTVNGVKTEYLVDKNRDYAQVLEESVNNALGVSYIYGRNLISQERGSADSYYLVDGLGSTRGLANGAGGVTDVYNYDAFGNLIGRTGSTVNNYLFAGEQYDSNLEGYYLRKRYYDEYRGRFTAQDPFEGVMSDPMSLHNYLYAHSNPVNAIDPSGLSTLLGSQLDLIFAIGALAAIGWATVNTVFTFKEGTPNEFPPAPPPFPIPRSSEPEILINQPPADGFPPSPEPFPMPQPEKPEPLITRVPLLGLKEYLDNYVFDSGIDPEDRYLHDQAREISSFAGHGNRRTIGVARVKFPDGRIEHVVATSFAYFTPKEIGQIRDAYPEYTVLPDDRNNPNHAELLIIEWAEAQGITVEAIGVSHPQGICKDCWNSMSLRQIKRASALAGDNYTGKPPNRPLD